MSSTALAFPLGEGSDIRITGVSQETADAMRAVYLRTKGHDFAKALVEEARDPSSVLHKRFTWDKEEAAEKWLLHQAEMLIRRVKVIIIPAEDKPAVAVRAFVSDRDAAPGGTAPVVRRYVGIEDLSDHGEALVRAALRDLSWVRARYKNFAAFSDLLRGMADEIDAENKSA